jgi:hypothetical protein
MRFDNGQDAAILVDVTSAMIEAGLDALYHSGAVKVPLVSDREVVAEIYQSMDAARDIRSPARSDL